MKTRGRFSNAQSTRIRAAIVIGLFVFALAPAGASAQAKRVLKDQYIVVLKADAGHAAIERTKRKTREKGGRVKHEYSSALKGFAATLSDKALREVRGDPAVDYIEPDAVVSAAGTQTNAPWNLDRLDQHALPLDATYAYRSTGSNVTAYVIDSGIRTTHQQFGGRATSGFDVVDDQLPADDCSGHGTHVAGTLGGATYGVAKGVKLVAVRVLDCIGAGTQAGVIEGVDYVTTAHRAGQPAVANMSLRGFTGTSVDQAVQNSIADGVTYVVAAGNGNDDACNHSPSRVRNALTVGATTSADARSSFSSWGSCLDLFAPGSRILSAWNWGDTDTRFLDGTSMAAAHVTGAAARYLGEHLDATPDAVASAIKTDATLDKVTDSGPGSPNRLLYVDGTPGSPPSVEMSCEPLSDYRVECQLVELSKGSLPSSIKWYINGSHYAGLDNEEWILERCYNGRYMSTVEVVVTDSAGMRASDKASFYCLANAQ